VEPRLSLVTLGVSDLARSRAFYERLGWRAGGPSNENVVFFQAGGMILGLWDRDHLAADAGLAPGTGNGGTGKFGGIALAHNVRSKAEVDALMAEAEAAGARILRPAQDVFWGGYTGYFADPDGHPWEVAWNLGFPIAEDGSVRLPEPG
jgi:catechol 2,3-dioxygenase-like lactoylglutathione lyase family enzyme